MAIILFLVCGIIMLVTGSLLIGIWIGKRSRKIGLSELGSPQMFAYLLRHERHRHIRDVEHIDQDLRDMARLKIYPPDAPLGLWIDVNK